MALINFGVGLGPSAAIAMVPYIAFDVLVLDAAMGALGLKAYLEAQKPNALNLKAD